MVKPTYQELLDLAFEAIDNQRTDRGGLVPYLMFAEEVSDELGNNGKRDSASYKRERQLDAVSTAEGEVVGALIDIGQKEKPTGEAKEKLDAAKKALQASYINAGLVRGINGAVLAVDALTNAARGAVNRLLFGAGRHQE